MDKLQKIEEALHIKFEKNEYKKKQDNVYDCSGNGGRIYRLQLKGVVIDDINILLPLSEELGSLALINCTIGNISSLIHFEMLWELKLDNVIINNIDEISQPNFCTISYKGNLRHVYLKNMSIAHLSALVPMAKEMDHLFITNCTIHNFYEINLLPNLYDLRLDGVTIKQSKDDIVHQAIANRWFIRICLSNMKLKDLDVFLPISENVTHIRIDTSVINSIRKLYKFKKLMLFEIDSVTTIKDRKLPKDKRTSFHIEECIVGEHKSHPKALFDIQNLAAIAPYIQSLKFSQYVSSKTDFLSNFSQLEALEFDSSTVPLSDFLPVAHQIKTVSFRQSKLKKLGVLKHFTQLKQINIDTNYGGKSLKDFKKLLPLKHQLKKLDINEEGLKNIAVIKAFTALASLDITTESVAAAQGILSLKSLKKLRLYIGIEPSSKVPQLFDLKALKNIQKLSLSSDEEISFTGIELLTQLDWLALYCNCLVDSLAKLTKLKYLSINKNIDVNKIPAIPSLRVLDLDVNEGYEIHSLEQFPNVEKLKIQACSKINLGKLDKLKVLSLQWVDLETTTCFDHLPNLEKLDLTANNISRIKNLDKLTNLKILDLSENNIEHIDGLEHLKKLEHLNLYENKISDIRILNKLPNLKQVNVERNNIEKKEVEKQLKKPEIACFMGLPRVPFIIWRNRYFKL